MDVNMRLPTIKGSRTARQEALAFEGSGVVQNMKIAHPMNTYKLPRSPWLYYSANQKGRIFFLCSL